jgi:ABC-type lipoprotein release transport system permease subunit
MKIKSLLRPLIIFFLQDRSTKKFILGVLLGLSFSIAVILATIGIMDGFEITLKKGLKRSVGDVFFYSRDGFFTYGQEIKDRLLSLGISLDSVSTSIQTQGFLAYEGVSKGIIISGIEEKSFFRVTKTELQLTERSVVIGVELAKQLGIEVGDEVILGLATGNNEFKGQPSLNRVKVTQIFKHGIYKKDLRSVYMMRSYLQDILNLNDKVNLITLNLPMPSREDGSQLIHLGERTKYTEYIENFLVLIRDEFGLDFVVRPFWDDFSTLIRAVNVEKAMITIILQIIVIISIFNVIAFIIFLNEKHAKEIFMLRALGLAQNSLAKIWLSMIFLIWFFACLVSMIFVQFIEFGLLSFLELPADVYFLQKLTIELDWSDYIIVFLSAFCWLFFITWLGLKKIKKKGILHGLREEFS